MFWSKFLSPWMFATAAWLLLATGAWAESCKASAGDDEIGQALTVATRNREMEPRSTFMLRPALLGSNLQNESAVIRGGFLRRGFDTDPINPALALVWFTDPDGVDLRHLSDDWRKRINPMVGVPLERFGERWYLGLNVLVAPGFDANFGLQFEEIDRLSRSAPIVYENGTLTAHTESRWRSAPFVGVSFDAVLLLDRLKGLFE